MPSARKRDGRSPNRRGAARAPRDTEGGSRAGADTRVRPYLRTVRRSLYAAASLIVLFGILFLLHGRSAQADLHPIPGQNVLLITIDTLRADALSVYGGPASTPALDRLADEGVRFDFAHAHAVLTLPSHVSILTGEYPFQHGVRENSG
ncbi:MAG: hypothetical protein DMG04_25550, partial [Acidobacteria bacterium]